MNGLVSVPEVVAYLDPASASLAIQAVVAFIAGIGVTFSSWFLKPLAWCFRLVRGRSASIATFRKEIGSETDLPLEHVEG